MSSDDLPSLPVDFGNADEDGAVRLNTRGTLAALADRQLQLREGMSLVISDGELTARCVASWRDGIWVATISEWLA